MLSAKESHKEPTRSGLFTVLADVETQGRGVPGESDGNEWGRRPREGCGLVTLGAGGRGLHVYAQPPVVSGRSGGEWKGT